LVLHHQSSLLHRQLRKSDLNPHSRQIYGEDFCLTAGSKKLNHDGDWRICLVILYGSKLRLTLRTWVFLLFQTCPRC